MNESEEWKWHPEWWGYEISTLGRVRSWRRRGPKSRESLADHPRLRTPVVDKNGYHRMTMGGAEGKLRGVHQLVLETFKPHEKFEGAIACHNDGDPSNNRLDNLRWDTPAANMADRGRHGTLGLRLTDDEVSEIRRLYEMGFYTREIARVFKTTQAHVSGIVSGKVRKGSGE